MNELSEDILKKLDFIIVNDTLQRVWSVQEKVGDINETAEPTIIKEGDFEAALRNVIIETYALNKTPVIYLDENLEGDTGSDIFKALIWDNTLSKAIVIPSTSIDSEDQREKLLQILEDFNREDIVISASEQNSDVESAITQFFEKENLQEGNEGVEF